MSAKWREWGSLQAAMVHIARLDAVFGYPNEGTKTDTIARAMVHPQTGKALVRMKPVFDHKKGRNSDMSLRMTDVEKGNSVEKVDPDLVAEGYEQPPDL